MRFFLSWLCIWPDVTKPNIGTLIRPTKMIPICRKFNSLFMIITRKKSHTKTREKKRTEKTDSQINNIPHKRNQTHVTMCRLLQWCIHIRLEKFQKKWTEAITQHTSWGKNQPEFWWQLYLSKWTKFFLFFSHHTITFSAKKFRKLKLKLKYNAIHYSRPSWTKAIQHSVNGSSVFKHIYTCRTRFAKL